ncbi:MAG: UvrD-helicase domain-containing protein [Flavobacteriales bacterium]|nr:UvrD-helicase domain-containing protein [Flavobacteriales bacterium]
MEKNYFIYNASAGAGKTYTLVLEFLKLILKNPKEQKIKNILAITFTNKAANEMKSRIIESLVELSDGMSKKYEKVLCEYFSKSKEELKEDSQIVLRFIIHNYSLLSVSTIDKFNFRILRAFSKELNLPSKFSVEINPDIYIEESINELTTTIGENESKYGEIILNYLLLQYDENERKVNFRNDLKKRIKSFLNEKNYFYVNLLKNKSIEDYISLSDFLSLRIINTKKEIKTYANQSIKIIDERGIPFKEFKGGQNGIGFVFKKIRTKLEQNDLEPFGVNTILTSIENDDFYAQKSKYKEEIDGIKETLIRNFQHIYNQLIPQLLLDIKIEKELLSLQTNTKINQLLSAIKEEQDLVFIGDANTIINEHLTQEPSNYIYEKIGSRYEYFFFDEFQDTSELQWNNFLPLVENAIRQENHSVTLVGDVKQSIYRFKGGRPELLISEMEKIDNEYSELGKVINLPSNYRSLENVVLFNNAVYTSFSSQFTSKQYKNIFKNAHQKPEKGSGGRVQVACLDKDDYTNEVNQYILETIKECKKNGFNYKDIVILFRKSSDAKEVSSFLLSNGIQVLSEDALFLNQVLCIDVILNFLRFYTNSENKMFLYEALYGLYKEKKSKINKDFSDWFYRVKNARKYELNKEINAFFELNLSFFDKEYMNCYDLVEDIVLSLNFPQEYQTYFSGFLGVIHSFENSSSKSVSEFLEYWESEQERIKYQLPEKENSVQVMTVHKSKGLEFPVVIYPTYKESSRGEHQWYTFNSESHAGFETFYLNFNQKEKSVLSELEPEFFKHELEKEIDEINVNYVATTRAEQQLFICFPTDSDSKVKTAIASTYDLEEGINELFLKHSYIKVESKEKEKEVVEETFDWVSSRWNTKIHLSYTDENLISNQVNPQEYGILIHELLSKIKIHTDAEQVFYKAKLQGVLPLELEEKIKKSIYDVINHKELAKFFDLDVEVFNEREIIYQETILRADRIVRRENQYTIIDYKTGNFQDKYIKQIESYEHALSSLGMKVKDKYIVLIGDEIRVKKV